MERPLKKKEHSSSSQEKKDLLRRLGLSLLCGSVVSLVLFAAAAGLCLALDLKEEIFGWIAIPLAGISAFCAGYAHVRPIRRQGIVQGALAAAGLYLLHVAVALCFHAHPSGAAVLSLFVMLLSGAFSGVFASNRPEKRRR